MNPNVIQTYTGKLIDVFDPHPDDIDILDIAHALSHTCRFSGHTSMFYSVASHTLWCVDYLKDASEEEQLYALLHDASEAYITDMPTPIKHRLPVYLELERNLMDVIYRKFGLHPELPKSVKEADAAALRYEQTLLMNITGDSPGMMAIGTPRLNKTRFISQYQKLCNYAKIGN